MGVTENFQEIRLSFIYIALNLKFYLMIQTKTKSHGMGLTVLDKTWSPTQCICTARTEVPIQCVACFDVVNYDWRRRLGWVLSWLREYCWWYLVQFYLKGGGGLLNRVSASVSHLDNLILLLFRWRPWLWVNQSEMTFMLAHVTSNKMCGMLEAKRSKPGVCFFLAL